MKEKVKIAKGEVVYKYKKRYVLTPPKGTYRKAMYYYRDKNRTEIVLKKHGYFIEVLCSILLLLMVVIKMININAISMLYYDSTPMYYSGILYLNLKSNELGLHTITVEMYDEDELMLRNVLNPGDEFLTVNISNPKNEYILKIKSTNILGLKADKIVRLEVENIDEFDFYEETYTE